MALAAYSEREKKRNVSIKKGEGKERKREEKGTLEGAQHAQHYKQHVRARANNVNKEPLRVGHKMARQMYTSGGVRRW